MFVGIVKLTLSISESHSLKDKRMVLRRIKDRVRERASVMLNEVGEQDVWQRAELGCAVVSGDRQKAQELLDEVVRLAIAAGGSEIIEIAKDVSRFEGPAEPYAQKSQVDPAWVPDAWREDLEK